MRRVLFLAAVALLTACGSPQMHSPTGAAFVPNAAHPKAGSTPITHIVVIMQENRSFDNFFYNFPGADGASYGYGHGVKYPLQELPLKWGFDINHFRYQFLEDYDGGKNDGWDKLIRTHPASCPYLPYD